MLKYNGELYARFGRKHLATGKTGADWDAMEAEIAALRADKERLDWLEQEQADVWETCGTYEVALDKVRNDGDKQMVGHGARNIREAIDSAMDRTIEARTL